MSDHKGVTDHLTGPIHSLFLCPLCACFRLPPASILLWDLFSRLHRRAAKVRCAKTRLSLVLWRKVTDSLSEVESSYRRLASPRPRLIRPPSTSQALARCQCPFGISTANAERPHPLQVAPNTDFECECVKRPFAVSQHRGRSTSASAIRNHAESSGNHSCGAGFRVIAGGLHASRAIIRPSPARESRQELASPIPKPRRGFLPRSSPAST